MMGQRIPVGTQSDLHDTERRQSLGTAIRLIFVVFPVGIVLARPSFGPETEFFNIRNV